MQKSPLHFLLICSIILIANVDLPPSGRRLHLTLQKLEVVMGFVRCALPHAVSLVLPETCLTRAAEDYVGIPLPQTVAQVITDFLAYSTSGVPTLVDEKQADNPRISFCTPRYELVCILTPQKDAYSALRLTPLSLRTHHQIASGALRVAPPAWNFYANLPDLNRQTNKQAGLEAILACWKQARQPVPVAPLPTAGISSAQLAFLANVDTLIDLACQVELEQAARQERILVKGVEPTANARAHRFLLAAPARVRVGEYLQLGIGAAGIGQDGVVAETAGASLVLRFYQSVDLKLLQRVEWLLPKISTKQYAIQHAAVRALRNGEALNQRLLPLIVENRFEAYSAPLDSPPGQANITTAMGKPNPAQKTMIERALLVPDLLLALGPPGTGKTDTIREIVVRQAALGKKVLVTSKNNKAVDNVLSGLKNVQALRIGREDAVAPELRPLLIDNKAEAMQQKILGDIRPVQETLTNVQRLWPQIQQRIGRLARLVTDWRSAESGRERALSDFAHWQRASYVHVELVLERQTKHSQLISVRLTQAARRAENLRRRLEGFQRLGQTPLIGALFTFLAGGLTRDWQALSQRHRNLLQEVRKSRESTRRIGEAYRHFVTASEQAIQRKRPVAQAEETLAQARAAIAQALDDLADMTAAFPGTPVMTASSTPAALEASLLEWHKWYELMMRRRGLLMEWRDLLQTDDQALYPALIRSADVVGATCIGIATDLRFEDLEFDMMIADEAGQVQVMDLLVPLVRARRAILVGDHRQLPPVVEAEITQKIRENEPENQELGEWLEKSLFERLIERPTTPAANTVMLDTQYRMPRQIADFISGQFYAGNYHTGEQSVHADAFFSGSPMVFIDTMKEERHFEQRSEDGQGYFNALEARLIADLLLAYQSRRVEAGVIVPYKKQAEVIRRELRRRQSGLSEDALTSRVATVDSFQGREQDVILFGFTRSNSEGRIGFLTELRRLNVSLTRARRQLVLVGDSVTLSRTPDQDFARLIKALLESVQKTPQGYFHASELPRKLG
jgi:hypothetical protein